MLSTSKNQFFKVLLISLPCKTSLVINFPNLQGIYIWQEFFLSEQENIHLFPE